MTNTKTVKKNPTKVANKRSFVRGQVSHLSCTVSCTMYHVTHVACRRSPVICHLSLMPKATATDPQPANSPTMYGRMVGKGQKNREKKNMQKQNF